MISHRYVFSALVLLGSMLWVQPAAGQLRTDFQFETAPVSLTEFKKQFNGDTGKVRLLVMFSPT